MVAWSFESRMGLEAGHAGTAANPVSMRGLRSFAAVPAAQGVARTCPGNTARTRVMHTPVHTLTFGRVPRHMSETATRRGALNVPRSQMGRGVPLEAPEGVQAAAAASG
jgi:hypothetical protein